MKQIVLPVVIVVGLIVFFVIVDKKEFNHYDGNLSAEKKSAVTNVGNKKPKTVSFSRVPPTTTTEPSGTTNAAATKHNENEISTTENKLEAKPIPVAVPVLSPAEAKALIERMGTEREEAKKRGWIFYEDRFFSVQNAAANIQQTVNWIYAPKDNDSESTSYAKTEDYFTIKSKTPLEYHFVEPLFEHTIYNYTICCSARGNGKIIIFQKGKNDFKEFSIDSNYFETVACVLGDGSSLNTQIIPAITFQGDLQIESITVYQKEINHQWTVCLGSIEDISNIPDINKSNYPDCYYTAKFVIKNILDGMPAPQNIQLLIPAFLDNKITPLSTIMKKGDWKISIRPFSLATKEEQEIEQVDEIESYLLTPYILVAADSNSLPEFNASGIPILEGESYLSPFDNPVNPPLPDTFVEVSNREMGKELTKVKGLVDLVKDDDRINEQFQSAWDIKQQSYDSLNATMIWAKEKNSFFALPKNWTLIPSAQITENNLNAIVELDHLFESQGIHLIIQIVPDYRDIAALVLNPEFQKIGDQRSARVAKQLLERGVDAQYLSDELVKNAFNYERLFFYPSDFHPDEGAVDVMTTMMTHRLEQYNGLLSKDLDISLFSKKKSDTGYGEKLKWPKNVNIGSHEPDSNVQVPYVLYNNEILCRNPKSKILVFGNSFIHEPMTSNAYISYLASKTLYVCHSCSMSGVSALTALPQLFLSSPEAYFKNKQIAILPVSVTYFTDDRYAFPNIAEVDKFLKNSSKSEFLADLPIKNDNHPVFSPSFIFSYSCLPAFLPFSTSCISLSKSNPKIILTIPDDLKASKVRISIQALFNYGVSILVNEEFRRLPSRYEPQWDILEFDIAPGSREISIGMDFDNCSSPDAKVLIGNVSLFK